MDVTCAESGSKLIAKQFVAEENFQGIAQKAAQVLQWIREARGK